jgi:YaiO family outer membrane protein
MRLRRSIALFALAAGARLSAQEATEARPDSTGRTYIGVDLSYVRFTKDLDPWQLGSVAVTHKARFGSVIARVNYADRFGSTGYQGEVDAYPRLSASSYLYLNYGHSEASVFPRDRLGAEYFTSLPQAWEASLGFRQLRFGGAPVTLFTGAVGKYTGNYWYSLRPYVRFKDNGTSASAGLTVRRYFADGDNWFGGRVSYGSSPTDETSPDAVGRTSSFSATVNGSATFSTRLLFTWAISHDADELVPGRTRRSFTFNSGLRVGF